MGVSPTINWFNHTAIQEALSGIGITYTMADKEAKSVPYININDVSFLKRTWRWDNDVRAFLCPLEHASIEKMLTKCVRSKVVSAQHQAISTISSAIREYFFYGRIIFEEKRKMFLEIIEETDLGLYVQDSTLPHWEDLKNGFWAASQEVNLTVIDERRMDCDDK
jgi:hypothetical protein